MSHQPIYAGEGSWREEFEQLVRARGYLVQSCSNFDPTIGWTLLLTTGDELEATTTSGMRRAIERLPLRRVELPDAL